MRILETRFNTDCSQYRLTCGAQTSLYVMVQIRDGGFYRDFKSEWFLKRRVFLMHEGFVIPVKSHVEYLNWLLKPTITGMCDAMAAEQVFVALKVYTKWKSKKKKRGNSIHSFSISLFVLEIVRFVWYSNNTLDIRTIV